MLFWNGAIKFTATPMLYDYSSFSLKTSPRALLWVCHGSSPPTPQNRPVFAFFSQPSPHEGTKQLTILSEPAACGLCFCLVEPSRGAAWLTECQLRCSHARTSDVRIHKCVWPALHRSGWCCAFEAMNWNSRVCSIWLSRLPFKHTHKGALQGPLLYVPVCVR